MCTIGNLFSANQQGSRFHTVFKQCDLKDATEFNVPMITMDLETKIRYVAFTRNKEDGTTPAWSGINEYGVSFVAADSYLKNTELEGYKHVRYINTPHETSVFDMYLNLIAKYKTASEAVEYAAAFYREEMAGSADTDILLVADANCSYFIEAYAGKVISIERREKFFVSTNHMRMIYGAVPYENNHSTYLRLERAEAVLEHNPTHNGVGDLLRDQYYGESVWSICRSNEICVPEESPFYTQASVIFNVPSEAGADGKRNSLVEFVINGKPDEKGKGVQWKPFTDGEQISVDYIGKGEL